jgi:4-amino-4-deoxy-L-arabinose transferase-like glycosyltransferase
MNAPDIINDANSSPWQLSRWALMVMLIGTVIRLYAFYKLPLFSSDGIIYIQQAKALYYGQYDQIFSCYQILYNYPVFVALFYKIIGDWLAAARCVSLFFSMATFLPMYWLLRRFFNDTISCLSLLIFVLLPPYVIMSQEVMRGSVYMFFAAMGLYLFILQFQKRNGTLLLLAGLSLLMATWARKEAALFVLVGWVFLIFSRQQHKWFRIFYFTAPYLVVIGLAVSLYSFSDVDLKSLMKLEQQIENIMPKFEGVYEGLKMLSEQPMNLFALEFFKHVRNLIWWLALGVLLSQLMETLFYIFPVVLVAGVIVSFKRLGSDKRLMFLAVVSLCAFLVLYFQIFFTWIMTSRFTLLFILPAFVFVAAGVDKAYNWLQLRVSDKKVQAGLLMALIIMSLMMPKSLRATYVKEKLIINEIGEFIAAREQYQRPVKIGGAFKRLRYAHFYANLKYKGAPCYDWQNHLSGWRYPTDPQYYKVNGYHYYIWDEKSNAPQGLDWIEKDPARTFTKVREWSSKRWGRIILYEIQ